MARLSMIRQGGQGGNYDVEAGSPADEHDSRVQSPCTSGACLSAGIDGVLEGVRLAIHPTLMS